MRNPFAPTQLAGFMLLVAGICMHLSAPRLRADEEISREYQVKAAMIYNFVQFVEWPADSFESDGAPLVIGIAGPNPFGDVLERLVVGKSVAGRRLAVQYYRSPNQIGRCQVLFVAASLDRAMGDVMNQTRDAAILTVGETDTIMHAGGVIRFYSEDNKVRFEVNPDAAERARLKISSKLLKLARIFRKQGAGR